MHRVYSWPPVEVLVEAAPDAAAYRITLVSAGVRTAPMAIDAHVGADHASRMALGLYLRAWEDPARFLAQERLEARHRADKEAHIAWADQVVREAASLGEGLREASRRSSERPAPVDVSGAIDEYLGLVEVGHEIAIGALLSEGHSRAEAERIHAERTLRDFMNKWQVAPSRYLPTAARG